MAENPGGYADGAGLQAALAGADTVYLVSAGEAVDRVQQHLTAVGAAAAAGELAGVSDVVPTLTGHPARTVAEHLRAHPEDWTHLRG